MSPPRARRSSFKKLPYQFPEPTVSRVKFTVPVDLSLFSDT
jgi:hypothetical protein